VAENCNKGQGFDPHGGNGGKSEIKACLT